MYMQQFVEVPAWLGECRMICLWFRRTGHAPQTQLQLVLLSGHLFYGVVKANASEPPRPTALVQSRQLCNPCLIKPSCPNYKYFFHINRYGESMC